MKYIFTAFVLFALYPFVTQAQNNYKPAYIVNSQKDTLKGFVDYNEWWDNPKSFTFKRTLADQAENITVDNSREIAITGHEHFFMYNAPISKGTIELPNLASTLDSSYVTGNVFLKLIYSGKDYSLLSYKDNLKVRYYLLAKKEHQLQELGFYVYLQTSSLVKTVKSYQLQLLSVASSNKIDDPKFISQIMSAAYNDGDLFKVFQGLNRDTRKAVAYKSPIGYRFFAGGGAKSSTFTFNDFAQIKPGTNIKNTGAFFSGGADLLFNKTTKNVFLRGEFSYSSSHFVGNAIVSNTYSSASVQNMDLTQTVFTFSPQFIYSFYASSKLKFFGGVGLGINWSSYKYDTSKPSALNIELDKNWFSLPLKAGVVFNDHFEAHVGYTTLGSIAGLRAISNTSLEGGINYLF